MNCAIMFYIQFRRLAMTHIVSMRNHLHSGQCSFPTAYGIVVYVDTKAEVVPLMMETWARASHEESRFFLLPLLTFLFIFDNLSYSKYLSNYVIS
jgi:hypothetical protein